MKRITQMAGCRILASDEHGRAGRDGFGIDYRLVGDGEDKRGRAERGFERFLQSRNNPAAAKPVVHDEQAVGVEAALDVRERFLGEQVAFQADIAVTAVQDEGIDEDVDDEVILRLVERRKLRPSPR